MSTLRTNALEGVDAKNSITIVAGAGNITTTSMQQGLAKMWIQSANDATSQDNINVSGGTDNGTGDYTFAYTNNMNNDDYAVSGMSDSAVRILNTSSHPTNQVRTTTHSDGGADRDDALFVVVHGDLA